MCVCVCVCVFVCVMCVRVCVCVFIITFPNFRHFDDVLLNLRLHSDFCLFVSTSCLSSSFLPSSFIVFYPSSDTRRRPRVESARVFHFLSLSLCR